MNSEVLTIFWHPTVKGARRELIHIHLGLDPMNLYDFETHLGASLKWKPRSQGLLELNCHPKTAGHLPVILSNGQIRKHLNNFDNFDIPNGSKWWINESTLGRSSSWNPSTTDMNTRILPGAGLCRVPWGNRVEIGSSPKKTTSQLTNLSVKNVESQLTSFNLSILYGIHSLVFWGECIKRNDLLFFQVQLTSKMW